MISLKEQGLRTGPISAVPRSTSMADTSNTFTAGAKKVMSGVKKAGDDISNSNQGRLLRKSWGPGGEGRAAVGGALNTAKKYWSPGGEGREAVGKLGKTIGTGLSNAYRKMTANT